MEPNTAEASAPAPQHPSFLAGAQNFSIGTQSIATVRTQNNVESVATMNNVETVGTLNNFTVERQIIELRTGISAYLNSRCDAVSLTLCIHHLARRTGCLQVESDPRCFVRPGS